MGLRSGKDEHHPPRRLLQGLQEGVEGLIGQHMNLIDNVDLVAGLGRDEVDLFAELPYLIDPPVARPVNLHHIQRDSTPYPSAGRALIARFAPLRIFAVHRPSEDAGHGGLPRPPRPGKQIGMRQSFPGDGILQGFDSVFLADDFGETLGSAAAIERLLESVSHLTPFP